MIDSKRTPKRKHTMKLDMKEARKAEVIEALKEADDALADIREKSKADGNIPLSKRITIQMMRIELVIGWIEEDYIEKGK